MLKGMHFRAGSLILFCFVASIGCIPSPHNARSHKLDLSQEQTKFFNSLMKASLLNGSNRDIPPVRFQLPPRDGALHFRFLRPIPNGSGSSGKVHLLRGGLKIGWTEILGWFWMDFCLANLQFICLVPYFWAFLRHSHIISWLFFFVALFLGHTLNSSLI